MRIQEWVRTSGLSGSGNGALVIILLTALLALTPRAALADEVGAATSTTPGVHAAAIKAAEATGRTIFEHDRAAAVATDAALSQRAFKRDRRVRGWLTEQQADGIAVTFIDTTPGAIYRVMVSPAGVAGPLLALAAPESLTPYEAGAAIARAAVLDVEYQRCSNMYNTVVLPGVAGTGGNEWMVYLLPGTTRHDTVPLGGTYRFEVRDGAVVSQRSFTRSCIALNRGPKVAGMMIDHLLDPTPTEAHVHWSLWAETPMYVSTPGDLLWSIKSGVIAPIKDEGINATAP